MSRRVAITGMGIISSIGENVSQTFSALSEGRHGISDIEVLSSRRKVKVGEIKITNEELALRLGITQEHHHPRSTLLGIWAAKEALAQAGIHHINDVKTGLISSTTVGGMDITEQYFLDYENLPEKQKFILSHDAGASSLGIASYFGLKGLVSTVSTACSSAANAIMMGAKLIRSGVLDRVIVGGTDALSKFTLSGFSTLMIVTDSYNTPFDEERKGLNLGEAAAFLVLESDEIIQKENKKVLAYLSGYANANDAHHQTASSEEGTGAYLAMQNALKTSGLDAKDIGYINAHGTATPNNDITEGRAIARLFGETIPPFSSTKPFTGHTLAAAAAVEAVISILALKNQVLFPNLNFTTPISALGLTPVLHFTPAIFSHVMSNSFGFGGNCSALIFSKA